MHVLRRVKENVKDSCFSNLLSVASENKSARTQNHLIILMCQRFDTGSYRLPWRSWYCGAKRPLSCLFFGILLSWLSSCLGFPTNSVSKTAGKVWVSRLAGTADRNSQNTFEVNSLELLPHIEHKLPINLNRFVFLVSTLLRGRVLSPFFRFCVFFLSLWLWTGWGGGGILTFFATARFSCTSTHTSCYAIASFSCTFTHTSCYATASFSCTFTHTSCYATAKFLLHIHTYVMLRCC